MSHAIKSAAVIGAGTMGAAIAAIIADAGLPVLLLDVVPDELTAEEKAQGLTLDDPQVRNRIARAGFERMRQARPPAFSDLAAEQRLAVGNTSDDFEKLAGIDLIIEAIIEKVAPKQALYARLETVRRPDCIVTSNTSGLPIALLAEGRSAAFKRHFLGTHFYNPPQAMKLLEIIPTAETEPAITQTVADFGETRLGKGIVLCKDTPNFIGNRLFSLGIAFAVQHALENGYTVAEVDALAGPLIARPKTAVFRLLDLIGIDVMAYIFQNLYDLIPDDPNRELLRAPHVEGLFNKMLERGWLGNKRGQGFYKKEQDAAGNRIFKILETETFEYVMPKTPRFESVAAVQDIEDVGHRLTTLFDSYDQSDRARAYVWAIISYDLAYAAARAPEIAFDLKSVDDAMRWGFRYEVGPFQLWDRLGVARTVARMEAAGQTVAPWVKTMLEAGCPTFYRSEQGQITGVYDWHSRQYEPVNKV